MILYFADRKMNILGYATTQLKSTYLIVDDKKTEEVESGVSSFECEVSWASKDRLKLETMMDAGNYILRSNGNEKDFLTIIETNIDTSKQTISVYAEDAGMDLLNEVAMPFIADKAYDIAHYIGLYAIDTGFEIGINEIPNLARKLSWDGETTCTERIASIATQFDNAEISYSFETKGLLITHKYINIFKKRGKDTGEQLRLGYEIASIATNKSVANLATSLRVTGGIPDGKEEPITLKGYKYDDGDFYVSGSRLSSRKALAIWSRYVWDREPNKLNGYTGHIVQAYSYDTTSQQELCAHAITKLKKLCQMEVNYEADIIYLPENVKIGDRVNVVDNEGRLYTSTRVLKLETSVTSRKRTATLGEYLIKDSGISEKVRDLARQFAESTASVSRANIKAEAAKAAADAAKTQAEAAEDASNVAKETAEGAKSIADSALASANEAQNTANAARDAAGEVTEKVTGIVKDVNDAKTAADNAWKAASTAKEDAATAKTSAANAEKNAADAKTAADAAGTKSDEAVSTATAAQSDAAEAKTNATKASETATAAKADAAQAQKEIDSLGKNLTTLSNTMKADYARKTDLTEAEASLKTKISQNAANIETTAKKVSVIDETANNAADLAATAQTKAEAAQTKADQATSEAAAAQTKADEASQAAQTAQSNADTAKAAAENAQSVADKAKTDLAEAQKNLATVKGRVDATEGDIAKAQKAVTTAQAAAEKAQSDANAAATKASSAQDVADAAKTNASLAQTAANQASAKAEAAQTIANEAKVNASDAQKKAADAVKTASDAKTAANNAAQTASDAQDIANTAKANATAAQAAADDAKKKSDQAAADLVTAKKNLEEVSGRVDSTAEEVEAAKTAVATAQAAADKAKTDAAAAQSTADTAKANASNAQKAADTAKTAADNAQKAADDAQKAADKAQDDVNALTKRVVNAETSIKQNSEAIELRATKKEVTQSIKDLQIGGRNLLLNSNFLNGTFGWTAEENCKIAAGPSDTLKEKNAYVLIIANTGNGRAYTNSRTDKYHLAKTQYTLQFKYKTEDSSPVTFKVGVADSGYIIGNITAPADNTWRKFTATYTAPMTGSLTIRITSGTGQILIGVPKLEYGNKATDWTPAPEDFQDDATTKANNALASAKTYADAQIKVAADSISQNVSKVQAASIISSQEQFYQSTSPTALTGGSWSNTQPAWTSGKYIWRRTLVTYGNNKTGYTPSETGVCITGNTGATGSTGLKALQPLKSFTGIYTTIGSTASENVTSFNRTPVVGDTFINLDASSNTGTWQVTTVSNGTATFKLLSCVSSKGAKGDTGATGKGIKSTAITYQASSSGTTVPTGTWVTSVPATNAVNPYLWTRTVITYTDNTTSTSYAVGSTLEGVSVGGRNLILNGKGDKKAGFFKNFTTVTDEYSEFTLTSKKEYVNIDIGGGFLLGCRDYTVGEQVTWSYDIMYTAWNFPSGTYHNELWMGQRYTNAPSGETDTGAWTGVTKHDLPVVGQNGCELNKWFHVKKTLTIPKQTSSNVRTYAVIQFYNSNANVAAGFTARLKNVKLERGNVATDWSPAPEDLATADNVNDKLTELRQEVNSNIEQTGEAIKSSVYEKVYLKDDVDTLLSSVNTEVEQTKTSWQVTFNQLVKQLNDYSDGSDAAFDEIRKYIRFEDGNILLGNSSSPLILRIRNDRIQFLQNGYEVAYISDQRMYNTTCEIINQLRIADSAWTVETNSNGDTIVSLIGL